MRYGPRQVGPEGDIRALYRATRGEGFGAEVRRRILVGTYVLSAGYYDAYYRKAQQVRALDRRRLPPGLRVRAWTCCSRPTTPTPAFKAGEKTEDPVAMYLADIFVCAVSLAGLPGDEPAGRPERGAAGRRASSSRRTSRRSGMLAAAGGARARRRRPTAEVR